MKSGNESPGSQQEAGLETGRYSDDVVDELGVVCPPHTTEKKLVARIDARLLPFISLLYLLAFLDRVNIANAKSFGLVDDLHLDAGGVQYNTILTIFFVPCKYRGTLMSACVFVHLDSSFFLFASSVVTFFLLSLDYSPTNLCKLS